MSVKKVFNYSLPSTFEAGDKPKNAVSAVGYSVMDTETGEVFATRPNWFYPAEVVGVPQTEVEAGKPLLVTFHRTRDIKENLKRLYGDNKEKMLKALYCDYDPEEQKLLDKQMLDEMQNDGLTYDEDAIGRLSAHSPYELGEDGLTNFERELQKEGQSVEDFRHFQEIKDVLPDEYKNKSMSELKGIITDLLSKAQTPAEPSPSGEGVDE